MKIKLYKRPGKKINLINELRSIISKLTGEWFTKEVGENFYIDLHYQDVFVLHDNGKVKSFVMFTCLDGFIHITLFATDYDDRNKGYGSFLYNHFENYCIKNGFKKFSVNTVPEEVNKNYHSTIKFYEKHGYKIVRIYKELWENGAVTMEKII
jgi:ribosomal protein S18 acetylase RimI-like enzyme